MSNAATAPNSPLRPSSIAIIALAALVVIAFVTVVVLMVVRGANSANAAEESDAGDSSSDAAPIDPIATETPSSSTSADPTAPAAPSVPAGFVMPSCTELALASIADRVADGEWVETTRDGEHGALADAVPGPVAAAAAAAAPQVRSCTWGRPNSDAGSRIWVAEMTQAQWDSFAAQLAAGGWTPTEVNGAAAFSQLTGGTNVDGDPSEWWYIHTSGGWIATTWSTPDVRSAAVAGLRATNP